MILRLLCFTLLLCLSFSAKAQLSVGGTAGSSILYPGFLQATFLVEKQLTPSFFLRSGAGFRLRAHRSLVRKVELDPDISSASSSYWSLPVQIRGQLSFKNLQIYGIAGLEAGWGHRIYYIYIKEQSYYNGRASFQEFGLRKLDLGLSTGFGVQYTVGKGHTVFVDYQFYLGLIDLDRTDAVTIYNESQGISVGMLIPISTQNSSTQSQK